MLPQAMFILFIEIRQLLCLKVLHTSLLITQLPMDLLEWKSGGEIGVRLLLLIGSEKV